MAIIRSSLRVEGRFLNFRNNKGDTQYRLYVIRLASKLTCVQQDTLRNPVLQYLLLAQEEGS